MNIVVIGSCTDSSILAKELNKRLNNSIIARVDALRNIKQLVLPGLGLRNADNLGAYVGDVEIYDYSNIPSNKKEDVVKAIASIEDSVSKLHVGNNGSFLVSTFDALTNGLPTGSYSFIKVYSGIINDRYLTLLRRDAAFVSNAVIVVVKSPKDELIPISIEQKNLDKLKEQAFAFVECNNIEEVFGTEVFSLLLESDKKEKEEPTSKEEETTNNTPGIIRGVFNLEPANDDLELVADAA